MERTNINALLLIMSGLMGTAVFSNVRSVAVKRGDSVMLPCSFVLRGAGGYFSWFWHGPNNSVPLCIMSMYDQRHTSVIYHNGFRQDRIKLHRTNSSCEIINVDSSDPGLYFCGFMRENTLRFDSATRVKVEAEEVSKEQMEPTLSEGANGSFTILPIICVLGGLNAMQLIVIFVLVSRAARTGQISETNAENKQDEDPDTLNYAALSFAQNRRSPRRRQELDSHVIYAAAR